MIAVHALFDVTRKLCVDVLRSLACPRAHVRFRVDVIVIQARRAEHRAAPTVQFLQRDLESGTTSGTNAGVVSGAGCSVAIIRKRFKNPFVTSSPCSAS
jgi:hypothetical protein